MAPRLQVRLRDVPASIPTIEPDRDFYVDPPFLCAFDRDVPDDAVAPPDNPMLFAVAALVVEGAAPADGKLPRPFYRRPP